MMTSLPLLLHEHQVQQHYPPSFRPTPILENLFIGREVDLCDGRIVELAASSPHGVMAVLNCCAQDDAPFALWRSFKKGKCRMKDTCTPMTSSSEGVTTPLDHIVSGCNRDPDFVAWKSIQTQIEMWIRSGHAPSTHEGGHPSDSVTVLFLNVPARDDELFPLDLYFPFVSWVVERVWCSGRVVFYCAAGRSRSVSLAMAAILAMCSFPSLEEARNAVAVLLRYVQSRRCCACPNQGFLNQLLRWAEGRGCSLSLQIRTF